MTQSSIAALFAPFLDSRSPVADSPGYRPGFLDRLKHREKEAQELVFRSESPALIALAATRLTCKEDAEPLVADVLSDFLFNYVDELRHDHAIPAYLRIMTVRRAHRINKQRLRDHGSSDEDMVDSDRIDPVDRIDAQRLSPVLYQCMGILKERDYRVLKLHVVHELSLAEIGQQMGVSKQAIAKIVHKCLDRLRRQLKLAPLDARPASDRSPTATVDRAA